jgi:serine/threonine protein kinase
LTTKIGTLFYASPEVLSEEKYNFPADVWSLGIVFFEVLLGKRIVDMVKGKLPPAFRPEFPSEALLNEIEDENLRNLVKKMLEKDPQKRLKAK